MLLHGCGCKCLQPGTEIQSVKQASAARHPGTCSKHAQGARHWRLITYYMKKSPRGKAGKGPHLEALWVSPVTQPPSWRSATPQAHYYLYLAAPYFLCTQEIPATQCLQTTFSWGGICVVQIDCQLDRVLHCRNDKVWPSGRGTLQSVHCGGETHPKHGRHHCRSRPESAPLSAPWLSWSTPSCSCQQDTLAMTDCTLELWVKPFLPSVAFAKYFNHWTKKSNWYRTLFYFSSVPGHLGSESNLIFKKTKKTKTK